MSRTLRIALLSEVFTGPDGGPRLRERLGQARAEGGELAVLPELPLDPWIPASDRASEADVEPDGGSRARTMASAAAEIGIGLVGGAIVRDAATGERRSRAFVYDAGGRLRGTYDKLHLPHEPGFWETSHYLPGQDGPRPIEGFPLLLGLQLCSDVNRSEGTHLLSALGAEAILAPRATEAATYSRWRLVLQANALTDAAYVVSVNRPAPENGVPLGGPSIVVGPDGAFLLETTEPLAVVTLDAGSIDQARRGYPGYLPVRARLYADAWDAVAWLKGQGPGHGSARLSRLPQRALGARPGRPQESSNVSRSAGEPDE